MNLTGVRYVLFDAVGTLIEARPRVTDVYASIGAHYGSKLTPAEIQPRFAAALASSAMQRDALNEAGERRRWQQIVAAVLDDAKDPDGAMFEALWQHFAEPAHWALFDDANDSWQAVIRSGRRPGIASNFDARLRWICAGHSLLAGCTTLLLSSEIGFAKPDPRFFAAAAKSLSARPEEILLIGDDLASDYQGALAAGWHAVLLDRGGRHNVPHSIASLRELDGLLRSSA